MLCLNGSQPQLNGVIKHITKHLEPATEVVTISFECVTSQLECVDYDSLQMSAYSNLYTHLPNVSGNGTNNITTLNATHVHDVIEQLEEAVGCEDASCQVRNMRVTSVIKS